jgi:hypothetical protein
MCLKTALKSTLTIRALAFAIRLPDEVEDSVHFLFIEDVHEAIADLR